MSLSKPVYTLLGVYLEQLFNHPVRTKAITASFLGATANYTSQRVAGKREVNRQSVVAYALFGLIFGGSIPHYFYQVIERLFKGNKLKSFFQFVSERLLFAPFYQALSLYFLSIFELNSHQTAINNLEKLYWPLLKANWQYLSIAVFLNIFYVPPMFRTLTMGLVSFVWLIYVAKSRRNLQENKRNTP